MSAAAQRPFAAPEEASPGPREMLAIAARHRFRIALAALLPPLLALALILVLPKSYRAQTDIVVKTGAEYMAQGNGESANLTAPTSTKQESINSEVALLSSRAVAEKTIAAIGLNVLYPDIVESPPSAGTVMDAAVLHFARDLSIDPVKLSNVIALSFDASSLPLARRVLDTLVRVYVETHTQVFAARRAEGYRDSIDTALGEVRTLEKQQSALRLESGIFDVDAQRRALIQQRTDAETRLEDASNRQAKLQARIAYLARARKTTPATVQAASTEQSDAQIHAATALIDLGQQEAALRARLGAANPELQRMQAQIEATKRAATATGKARNATTSPSPLRQQLEADALAAAADLASAGSEVDRLRAFVASRNAELARLERADVALRDLVLRIDVVTQNLRAMQGRFEQARADEQTDLARQVSVVQVAAATGSEKPVSPKKLLFGAAGVLGGALLAGLVGLLAVGLSKTAATDEAAERRVGLPVLAVVPFDRDRRAGLRAG